VKSRTTERFRKAFSELPDPIKDQARQAYRQFLLNPRHAGLRFKKVHPKLPIYSLRVGIGYRAVGRAYAEEIEWFWIGTHADYDRLLSQL
jgi:hypothetical protein